MAKKKKVTARKKPSSPLLSRLQSGVKKMQRDGEALLGRARKEAVRFSKEQKHALDRIVGEAQRVRGDFEKLVKRTSKDLEARSKGLLSTLEKDVEKRIEPAVKRLVDRLDLAARHELQSLSRRIRELEGHLQQHSHDEEPAVRPQAPSAPAETAPAPAPGNES